MQSLRLYSIVVALAVGIGCSRASIKSPDASHGIVAGREVAESNQEGSLVPAQAKPSPCIKWEKGSGRFSKIPRKATGVAVSRDPHKNLQAMNETRPRL